MNKAKQIAIEVIENHNTTNPYEICDNMGIIIVRCNLPKNIGGFYQLIDKIKIIYINDNFCDEKKRYICAHELGHSIMHENYNSLFLSDNSNFIMNKFEREADFFASELLLFGQELNPENIMNLSQTSGLPSTVLDLHFGII